MAWTTPVTAVDGVALTAAQWNASVRDNLNLTPAALATTAGYHFVSTGTNAVAERAIVGANVDTSETTASTSYVDLATAGPSSGAITTGTKALVWINSQLSNSGANQACASYGVSGATTSTPGDTLAIVSDDGAAGSVRYGACDLRSLTAGSNTFYMQYRVVTAGTGTFQRRRIQVMAL